MEAPLVAWVIIIPGLEQEVTPLLPPCRETLPIHSILHIVSYKVGLMLCWYTPWVGHITI